MKILISLLVVAVAFVLGYGSADKWIAAHPKPVVPVEQVVEAEPEPEPEVVPEVVVAPEPEPEPEVVMVPEEPEVVVVEAEPEVVEVEAVFPPLVFGSREGRLEGTSPAFKEALSMTLESGKWDAYRDHLRAALVEQFAELEPEELENVDEATEGKLVRRVLSQERFLSKVLDSDTSELFMKNKAFAAWIMEDTALLDVIYFNLTKSDDPEKLLTFLGSLHEEMADTLTDYSQLAVACGLVFDSGNSSKAMKRFLWYVGMDREKRLYRDIKTMPVSDLVYVVDGVPLDQMNWVQTKYRGDIPRSGSGKVYSDIEYRMELVTGEIAHSELFPEYTLEAIKENGGICGDQAYFAQNVCRAVGIPAIKITGSGNRGGHAWVVYQDKDGSWAGHGRYENYATGTYRDPQVGDNTTESALIIRSSAPFRSAARVAKIRERSLVADLLTDSGDVVRATELAIQIAESEREYLPAWERVFQLIESQRERIVAATEERVPEPNALTAKRVVGIVKDFEIALRDEPDMLGRSDEVLTTTLEGILDDETLLEILKRRRKRVESYDSSRLTTILDLMRQEAEILARAEDFDAVTSLYRKELRSYGKDLQFFRKLAANLWDLSRNDPKRSASALGLLNAEVKSNFEVMLEGRDYFGKSEAITVYNQLRDYYYEAGNTSKVNRLEKQINRAQQELDKEKA